MAAARRKRKERGETLSRMAEATGAIRVFRSHGMSLTDMQKLTGVMRDHISAIERGQRRYVHTATIEKLYEGVAFLAGVGK
jgi:transcriptional regulator with XRE-family HTH domain